MDNGIQRKSSFDSATIKKIARGFLLAATGGAALAALQYLGGLDINNPTLAVLVSTMVPVLVNVIKEWRAGE
jgi:drug/metabolite transporter (DMT)-like permease